LEKKFTVCVDFGGTKILTALIDNQMNIINRIKIPTSIANGKEGIVEDIAGTISSVIEIAGVNKNEVKAVSMGVPGTVNPFTGLIGNAPNLKVTNYNIKEALEAKVNLPVFIENDVNLAALGIKKFEFKDNVKNMLIVFVGTGIGSALIFEGKLYRGSSFYAGEIGHISVNKAGKIGVNKKKVTFETIASRTAIDNAIRKDIMANKKSVLSDIIAAGGLIKSKDLLRALKKKDKIVEKHIRKASGVIGRVLGSIVTLLNIDTIVLGGGVIESLEDFMLPIIKETFNETVLKEPGAFCKIVSTKLGDDAALYGGIALCEEFNS